MKGTKTFEMTKETFYYEMIANKTNIMQITILKNIPNKDHSNSLHILFRPILSASSWDSPVLHPMNAAPAEALFRPIFPMTMLTVLGLKPPWMLAHISTRMTAWQVRVYG